MKYPVDDSIARNPQEGVHRGERQAINTVLQMMAHASSQGIYGRGRRRGRSGPRIDTMELLEQMDLE